MPVTGDRCKKCWYKLLKLKNDLERRGLSRNSVRRALIQLATKPNVVLNKRSERDLRRVDAMIELRRKKNPEEILSACRQEPRKSESSTDLEATEHAGEVVTPTEDTDKSYQYRLITLSLPPLKPVQSVEIPHPHDPRRLKRLEAERNEGITLWSSPVDSPLTTAEFGTVVDLHEDRMAEDIKLRKSRITPRQRKMMRILRNENVLKEKQEEKISSSNCLDSPFPMSFWSSIYRLTATLAQRNEKESESPRSRNQNVNPLCRVNSKERDINQNVYGSITDETVSQNYFKECAKHNDTSESKNITQTNVPYDFSSKGHLDKKDSANESYVAKEEHGQSNAEKAPSDGVTSAKSYKTKIQKIRQLSESSHEICSKAHHQYAQKTHEDTSPDEKSFIPEINQNTHKSNRSHETHDSSANKTSSSTYSIPIQIDKSHINLSIINNYKFNKEDKSKPNIRSDINIKGDVTLKTMCLLESEDKDELSIENVFILNNFQLNNRGDNRDKSLETKDLIVTKKRRCPDEKDDGIKSRRKICKTMDEVREYKIKKKIRKKFRELFGPCATTNEEIEDETILCCKICKRRKKDSVDSCDSGVGAEEVVTHSENTNMEFAKETRTIEKENKRLSADVTDLIENKSLDDSTQRSNVILKNIPDTKDSCIISKSKDDNFEQKRNDAKEDQSSCQGSVRDEIHDSQKASNINISNEEGSTENTVISSNTCEDNLTQQMVDLQQISSSTLKSNVIADGDNIADLKERGSELKDIRNIDLSKDVDAEVKVNIPVYASTAEKTMNLPEIYIEKIDMSQIDEHGEDKENIPQANLNCASAKNSLPLITHSPLKTAIDSISIELRTKEVEDLSNLLHLNLTNTYHITSNGNTVKIQENVETDMSQNISTKESVIHSKETEQKVSYPSQNDDSDEATCDKEESKPKSVNFIIKNGVVEECAESQDVPTKDKIFSSQDKNIVQNPLSPKDCDIVENLSHKNSSEEKTFVQPMATDTWLRVRTSAELGSRWCPTPVNTSINESSTSTSVPTTSTPSPISHHTSVTHQSASSVIVSSVKSNNFTKAPSQNKVTEVRCTLIKMASYVMFLRNNLRKQNESSNEFNLQNHIYMINNNQTYKTCIISLIQEFRNLSKILVHKSQGNLLKFVTDELNGPLFKASPLTSTEIWQYMFGHTSLTQETSNKISKHLNVIPPVNDLSISQHTVATSLSGPTNTNQAIKSQLLQSEEQYVQPVQRPQRISENNFQPPSQVYSNISPHTSFNANHNNYQFYNTPRNNQYDTNTRKYNQEVFQNPCGNFSQYSSHNIRGQRPPQTATQLQNYNMPVIVNNQQIPTRYYVVQNNSLNGMGAVINSNVQYMVQQQTDQTRLQSQFGNFPIVPQVVPQVVPQIVPQVVPQIVPQPIPQAVQVQQNPIQGYPLTVPQHNLVYIRPSTISQNCTSRKMDGFSRNATLQSQQNINKIVPQKPEHTAATKQLQTATLIAPQSSVLQNSNSFQNVSQSTCVVPSQNQYNLFQSLTELEKVMLFKQLEAYFEILISFHQNKIPPEKYYMSNLLQEISSLRKFKNLLMKQEIVQQYLQNQSQSQLLRNANNNKQDNEHIKITEDTKLNQISEEQLPGFRKEHKKKITDVLSIIENEISQQSNSSKTVELENSEKEEKKIRRNSQDAINEKPSLCEDSQSSETQKIKPEDCSHTIQKEVVSEDTSSVEDLQSSSDSTSQINNKLPQNNAEAELCSKIEKSQDEHEMQSANKNILFFKPENEIQNCNKKDDATRLGCDESQLAAEDTNTESIEAVKVEIDEHTKTENIKNENMADTKPASEPHYMDDNPEYISLEDFYPIPSILDVRSISPNSFEKIKEETDLQNNPISKMDIIDESQNVDKKENEIEEVDHKICLCCQMISTVVCENCLEASYCSKQCLELHWEAEHHKNCIPQRPCRITE